MTTVDLYNSFRTSVALYFGEAVIGDVPVDAAAWVAAEGTDAFRIKPVEADPSYILGDAAVPNTDMQPNVFETDRPHHGLPTADGGAMLIRLWSTGIAWVDATQIGGGTPTVQQRLLEHSLGRGELGGNTTVGAVTDPLTFAVASATNLAPGYIIAIEDADAPGRFWPVQVLTVAGVDITIDRELPFVPTLGDRIGGAELTWPGAQALTNPLDANYSTISVLYVRGSAHTWMAGGAHFALGEIQLPRGEQPSLSFPILAAKGYPQGAGSPTPPTFTGPIEGTDRDVQAVGANTKVFLQDFGLPTYNCTSVFEGSFQPGIAVVAEDGVTECDEGAPGRISYRTEPGDTILEIVVPLTDDQQVRWTAGTFVTASFMQVAEPGRGYMIHIRRGFLMQPPEGVLEGVNKWRLMIKATADESAAATGEALAAVFVLARF